MYVRQQEWWHSRLWKKLLVVTMRILCGTRIKRVKKEEVSCDSTAQFSWDMGQYMWCKLYAVQRPTVINKDWELLSLNGFEDSSFLQNWCGFTCRKSGILMPFCPFVIHYMIHIVFVYWLNAFQIHIWILILLFVDIQTLHAN